jgi:4-amino-4-deoxy-L-arabinose transferase-like glycosyltransferase
MQLLSLIKKKYDYSILIILSISLLLQLWYNAVLTNVWWDSAIYIGMGKYLFTHGSIGLWEVFRPPFLPIILGFVWRIGINPFIFGKILAIIFTLSTIFLTYILGEKVRKNVGMYAAILVGFTPVLFSFSVVPLTDIPSTFFTLAAVYYFLKNKNVVAGICSGIAFLFRFPQALILFPLLITALVSGRNTFSERVRTAWNIVFGFFIITLPYFIINYILFSNPFLPITAGNVVTANSSFLEVFKNFNYLYYFYNLFIENPFIIFGIIFIFIFIKNYKTLSPDTKRTYLVVFLSLACIAGYFTYVLFKVLRYSIAFLPYLSIAAGFGIDYVIEKLKKYLPYTAATYLVSSIIGIVMIGYCFSAYTTYGKTYVLSPAQTQFYHYFDNKPGVAIMTTAPQIAAFSDIEIAEISSTWKEAVIAYAIKKDTINYFAIDNCNPECDVDENTCNNYQKIFMDEVVAQNTQVFSAQAGWCSYAIYKRD